MYLVLIAFGVIVAFNMELHIGEKIIYFLDKISYGIFLNHTACIVIYTTFFRRDHFEKYNVLFVLSYVIMVVLLSIITYGFSKKLVRLLGES